MDVWRLARPRLAAVSLSLPFGPSRPPKASGFFAGSEGPTKSGKGRKVPLSPSLTKALKAHRGLRHLADARMFPGLDASRLKRHLRAACRRAGVAEVRWHDLRHSFASQLVSAGVSLRQVQAWLGHSTIAMTERYSHLAPGGESAIGALDGHAVDTTRPAASNSLDQRGKMVRAIGIEPMTPAV